MNNDGDSRPKPSGREIGPIESLFGRFVYAATVTGVALGVAAIMGSAATAFLSAIGIGAADQWATVIAVVSFVVTILLGTFGWLQNIDHEYWN